MGCENLTFTVTPTYVILLLTSEVVNVCWIAEREGDNPLLSEYRGYDLDKGKKVDIINKFELHKEDTGSTEVQVALLTERINQLTRHMAANRHDYHSQRGLLKLVGQRRRLLAYLSREDVGRYHSLITRLGLRK